MMRSGPLRLPMILLVMLFLQFLPLTGWLATVRPLWVAAVLVAWALSSREPRGLTAAWIAGLLLDAAYGSVLGQHALALTLLVFLAIQMRGMLSVLPGWQAALTLLPAWLLYTFILFWVDGSSQHFADAWQRWMPAYITSLIWPLLWPLLRSAMQPDFRE